ncbi:hypothetical protein [Ramlibacter rhizophilus]|uniref:Uncharacterized protein n=1 Tax=Ramlibacter rhizophilus TaxID=1781167 RepID=A0A4Z0C063_9BURK|nr:hypothetical protein [Ramlibacter rhizophilus]TFZ04322.1 hypothetical protein EZ242_00750 [Ramlibacter rhizophilus]
MATSITLPRQPRSLREISDGLKIDGSTQPKRAPVPDTAELRADGKSLKVKTGWTWITKEAARTEHRTGARKVVLDGLRQSLRDSYPRVKQNQLDNVISLAVAHLQPPADGKAITVADFKKLRDYADQISRLASACGLPLGTAQDVVHHFQTQLRGGQPPDGYSDAIMILVGHHLKENDGMSVDKAYRAVTQPPTSAQASAPSNRKARTPERQQPRVQPTTRAPVESELEPGAAASATQPQPREQDSKARTPEPQQATVQPPPHPAVESDSESEPEPGSAQFHEQTLASAYMPAEDLQLLSPQKRWQLLSVASQEVEDCFADAGRFQAVIVKAAKAMKTNPLLEAHIALARYAPATLMQRIEAFDLSKIGPAPKAAPVPSQQEAAFLKAMERATPDR